MSDSNGRIDSDSERDYRLWRDLVKWLESKGFDGFGLKVEARTREGAGRGLFATMKMKALGAPILSIPSAALLNARTLRNVYPALPLEGFSPKTGGFMLNATQLISLHLAIHRPKPESDDPHFGPYINLCPSNFEGHPLTWLVRDRRGMASQLEGRLLSMLPPSVYEQLCGVFDRFQEDFTVSLKCISLYGSQFPKSVPNLEVEDFLWGWLVVNTRCLFYRIFSGNFRLSNLTLCPIIDMANHTESNLVPKIGVEKHSEAFFDKEGVSIEVSDDFVFLSPDDRIVEKDEEVFLKYGDHSKSLLFTEYGFVDDSAEPEIDVTWLVKELVKHKPSSDIISQVLADTPTHFQSKMKFFMAPEPPSPSWNTTCTLRLINLKFPAGGTVDPLGVEEVMKPWYDVSLGIRDAVSDANEEAVREDLRWMTKVLVHRAAEAKESLQALRNEVVDGPGWFEYSAKCIAKLWQEQSHVASAVRLSNAANVKFC